MFFGTRTIFTALTIGLAFLLGGCEPSSQSTADDEKEPHFVLGQSRVNAMDYSGAVEAFEQSLEANPHSAAAHFQLAMLYGDERKINPVNPAAAIYHYQQYLRFDPKALNAEVVKQQITRCKQQLAADVMQLPSSPAMQQQLQQLTDKNRQLQEEVDRLRHSGQVPMTKTNWPAPAASLIPPTGGATTLSKTTAANVAPRSGKTRTYVVVARDTLTGIARKSGVNLDAVLAANPGLNPKKLRVGQSINLPSP